MGVSEQQPNRYEVTALLLAICLAQTAKSMSVTCGRYTTKTIKIGASTVSVFKTQRQTKRCTALYKVDDDCPQMKMYCGRFFVPNKDDFRCRRGDKFLVKAKGAKPKVYCNTNKPMKDFPALSTGALKVWYTAKQSKTFPNKGVTCKVMCDL